MKKKIFFVLLFSLSIAAQLKLIVHSDKKEYQYGEEIEIFCKLVNTSDSTISFFNGNYHSCQAEFILNDFNTSDYFVCFPLVEEIIIPPKSSRVYKWTVDPYRLGIPDVDDEQNLIGYFYDSDIGYFEDSTTFYAPLFLGGQLLISYSLDNKEKIDSIKNHYEIEVLESYSFEDNRYETWQVLGMRLEVYKKLFEKSHLFGYVDYNRIMTYDEVFVTSVNDEKEIKNDFILHQNYPNPFNSSTTIKFTLGTSPSVPLLNKERDGRVRLEIYNILGQKIRTLVNKVLQPGTYEVTFDASKLPSGVYFYRLTNGNYSATQKMLLMK